MVFRSIPWVTSRALRARASVLLAVCLALTLCVGTSLAADKSVYYAKGKAIQLQKAPHRVVVVVDDEADYGKVAAELAEKGMPTLMVPTHQAVYSRIRVAPVDSVDDAKMQEIKALTGIARVHRVYTDPATGRDRVAIGRIVLRMKEGTKPEDAQALAAAHGCKVVKPIEGLPRTYLVEMVDLVGDCVAVASEMYEDDRVAFCHPDFLAEVVPCQTSDTYYGQQWHLNNTGQSGATIDADVDWPEAWAIVSGLGDGSPVRIAVHDDSVQPNHEDLKAAYVTGRDFTDGDSDPSPGWADDNHGTCVSGVIVARINSLGVVGAAPTASLVGIRWGFTESELAEAFTYANSVDADIINNSWGLVVPVLPDVLRDAINNVATVGRDGKGMVVLFSSGNSNAPMQLSSPTATIPSVLAIGASNSNDARSYYSNYGPELTVVAPSDDFFTGTLGITTTDVMDDPNLGLPTFGYNDGSGTDIYGYPDLANGSYTQNFGGTSSACPLVSGICGLILQVNPNLTAEQVRRILEHSADQISPITAGYDPIAGHSEFYGYGRANAYRAVQAAQASSAEDLTWPPPVENLRQFGSATINLTWDLPNDAEVASVMVVHSQNPITWTPNGMRQGQTGQNWDESDPVAPGVQVVLNKAGAEEYSPLPTDPEAPGAGQHYYAVFVRNSANRWSWGRTLGVTLGEKNPPKASVSVDRRAGSAPLTVNFIAGAIDADLEDVDFTYAWKFGDPEGNVGSGQAVSFTYNQPGLYMARVTATDPKGLTGSASAIVEVTAGDNKPPTVRILPPGDGEAPHTVLLQAVASDETPESQLDFVWSFGDGDTSVAVGPIVEHTYTKAGAYPVTVTVTDPQGASSTAGIVISVFDSTTGLSAPAAPAEDGSANEGGQFPCATFGPPLLAVAMLGWFLLTGRRRR